MRLRVMPDAVDGVLARGWLRPRVMATATYPAGDLEARSGRTAEPTLRLSRDIHADAIDAVLHELSEAGSLQGARLDIELADALMHLDVVQGDFAGDSDRGLHSVAVACMAELLGDAAQGYEVRWQLQAGGTHLLIGAIAIEMLRTLTDAAARHGLRLRSVQPDFCLQWNRHSSALKPGPAVFAVACGREAVVACVSRGAIAEISSGGWLGRHAAANETSIGQPGSGFSAQADSTSGLLDTRVDRLLSSVGRDASNQSTFVLVVPVMSDPPVSSRWTVLKREAYTQ